MPIAVFEALNERQAEAGQRTLRQPPQRRGRLAAPEGRRRSPPAASWRSGRYQLGEVEGGPDLRQPPRDARVPGVARLPGEPRDHAVLDGLDEVFAFCRALAGAPPRPRLRDRRRGGEGRRPRPARASSASPPRRRGGPSPTSSRPRSAPRCSATSMVSIGRTGRATPFAVLEPVFVGGSTVGLATLHNEDQVQAKDVRPGDTVIVRKAGDVIPEVVGAGAGRAPRGPARRGCSPTDCPVCGHAARAARGRGRHPLRQRRLPGPASAGAIEHFASRGAMDIEGLGEQRVRLFCRAGPARATWPTSTRSTAEQLARLEGFGEISIDNLLGRHRGVEAPSRSPSCSSGSTSATWARRRRASPWPPTSAHLDRIDGRRRGGARRGRGRRPDHRRAACTSGSPTTRNRDVVEKLRAAGVNLEGPEAADAAPEPRRA